MRLYYLWFELKSCMITKEELKKLKTVEECQKYLRTELIRYVTLYSKAYADYEEKAFTEQIKVYEYKGNYVVVCSNLIGTEIKNMKVYLTKVKPARPHPLFPVPMGFIKDAKEFEFGDDFLDIEKPEVKDYLEVIKKKQKES